MDIKRKLLIAGFAALPALGVGGIAYASTPTSSAPSTASVSGSPAAATASGAGEPTGTEAPGTEAPDAGESGANSDGPGGHQDPAGAPVDHQFNGQE
jgi:hypothetical protein